MKKSLLTTLALAGILSVNAQTVLMTENFETTTGTALPSGWTNTSSATDGGFVSGTTSGTYPAGLSSQYFPVPALTGSTRSMGTNDDGCNCTKAGEIVSSPVINCSGQSTVFLSFDYFYAEGTYQGASETMEVKVSSNGGTTWTTVSTVAGVGGWTNSVIDISSVAANQSNVKIAFTYDDGGGWLFGAVVDNISVYAPAARDLSALSINMYAYTANNTNYTISGNIKNLGGTAITSMTLNYKVDAGAAVSQNLSSLNIAPLSTYAYSHGTPWMPTMTGNHTIKVWASNLNGSTDMVNANDTVMYVTYTCTQVDQRVALVESFTSSTCGPCAAANPAFLALLTANNYNAAGGKVALVKYQMNYPGAGNDPAYTAECGTRHTYYNVQGIPHSVMDGGFAFDNHPANMTQQDIDDATAVPAPVKINATAVYGSNTITVNGSVDAYANINGSNKLMIALVEDNVNTADGGHGTQSNGETDWHAVMRKVAPSTNGTNIGNMTAGSNYPYNVTTTFTGYTGSGTGTPKIFTNINLTTAVIWVQDLTSKVVYQAGFVDVLSSVDDKASALSTLDIYPNPSRDFTNIKFTLKNDADVVINVYDMMGAVVFTQNMGNLNAGVQTANFNSANFASGMYSVVITAGNNNTTAKVLVQK